MNERMSALLFLDAIAEERGRIASRRAFLAGGGKLLAGGVLAAAAIGSPALNRLTAAGTIVAVEARHASHLNLLNGVLPFPAAVEEPATREEVLEIAGPFFAEGDGGATPDA